MTPTGRHRRQLGEPLDQSVTPSACCFVVTADNKHIMACGYWDNSFKCFSADSGEAGIPVFNIRKNHLVEGVMESRLFCLKAKDHEEGL